MDINGGRFVGTPRYHPAMAFGVWTARDPALAHFEGTRGSRT